MTWSGVHFSKPDFPQSRNHKASYPYKRACGSLIDCTPLWSHTHTMERRTLCHLGRDRHRHLGCSLISERLIRLRWLSSCSSSQKERRQVRRNFFQLPFFPLAFETFDPINQVGSDFYCALGQLLSLISDDPRETSFLFRRLSVSIQCFNSVCFYNSFETCHAAQCLDQPRRT